MPQTLCGEIVRTTYANEETGFTIAKMKVKGMGEVTVVGQLMNPPGGTFLEASGQFENHSQYGPQFKVTRFTSSLPVTCEGIKKYLASKAIKGIGKTMAERLVAAFGSETLDVIDKHPERLTDVEGIGKKKSGTDPFRVGRADGREAGDGLSPLPRSGKRLCQPHCESLW